MGKKLKLPREKLAAFCKRYHIRRLSLFGSALTGDLSPESDIDFLVEFERGYVPTLLKMAQMERELSKLLGGRKVDLRTPEELSRYFREEVLQEAEVQYAQE